MSNYVQTEDKDYIRDLNSKALINTNVAAYHKYKEEKRKAAELQSLKDEVSEMKALLNTILEKITNGS